MLYFLLYLYNNDNVYRVEKIIAFSEDQSLSLDDELR